MYDKNKLKALYESRIARVTLLTGIGLAALTGCANQDGHGNEFSVQGRVESVGHHHTFRLKNMVIQDSHGEATKYFNDYQKHHKKFSFGDNYQECDWGLEVRDVGHEYDSAGEPESYDDIKPGDFVEVQGKIRDSYTKCGKHSSYEQWVVYDQVHEIPQ